MKLKSNNKQSGKMIIRQPLTKDDIIDNDEIN